VVALDHTVGDGCLFRLVPHLDRGDRVAAEARHSAGEQQSR
jgi:hypothetical protein